MNEIPSPTSTTPCACTYRGSWRPFGSRAWPSSSICISVHCGGHFDGHHRSRKQKEPLFLPVLSDISAQLRNLLRFFETSSNPTYLSQATPAADSVAYVSKEERIALSQLNTFIMQAQESAFFFSSWLLSQDPILPDEKVDDVYVFFKNSPLIL